MQVWFSFLNNSVEKSEKDYQEIYDIVNDAFKKEEIELFNVKAQELWADDALVDYLRKNPGWK